MALPLTITGISVAVAQLGPFRASSGEYFFIGVDGTTATTLQAYKSTAPDTSWSSIATKTGFATAIDWIAGYKVGDIIHIVLCDGTSSSSNKKYQTFDMSSETFVTAETIVSGEDSRATSNAAAPWCDIVVRSGGEVVVVYNSARSSTNGQIAYKRRTGVNTWSSAVVVSTGVDHQKPKVVLGASDRLHFTYQVSTNVAQRHLTSANVLGTAANIFTTQTYNNPTAWSDAGTIKVFTLVSNNSATFTSADNPTVTTVSGTFGAPTRSLEYNGTLFGLFRDSSSDISIRWSNDKGAVWQAPDSSLTGTVASAEANLSRNQLAYKRGANIVFPYLVNDAGTLKYNEYPLAAAPPEGALAVTEGADTLTSSALLTRFATLGVTEGADTLASVADLFIQATLARTEGADTLSSAATLAIAATFAVTEGEDTLSADGTLSATGITGNLSVAEGEDTLSAAGTLALQATLAVTEGADTLASAAALLIQATAAITEGADVLASAAGDRIATLGVTEGADTLASTGSISNTNFGSLGVTEGADTLTSSAFLTRIASLAVTEGADTLSSAGVSSIAGNLARTEGADTLAATGALAIAGNLSVTEGADTLSSAGLLTRFATLGVTEGADVLASTAALLIVGNLARTEGADTLASTAGSAVTGNLARTEGADTLASLAVLSRIASLGVTEGADTLFATADLAGNVVGNLNRTEGADMLASVADLAQRQLVVTLFL